MTLDPAVDELCAHVRSMDTGDGKLYKPAMLAAVLDAIDRGDLTANEIPFRPMVGPFQQALRAFGQDGGTTQAAYGFYHLSGEPFWELVYTTPEGPAAKRRTGAQLDEHVRHARFADPYWAVLQQPDARAHVRAALDAAWGPGAGATPRPSYWWVNHNQTYRQEIDGGYVWSPRTNKDGARNETYLNLTRVRPGDVVFSYGGGRLRAVGVATGPAQDAGRPPAFGETGEQWDTDGWLVPVEWTALDPPIRPKDHLDEIVPLLPPSHAPIRATGDGNQFCYLAAIGGPLGDTLLRLAERGGQGPTKTLRELQRELVEDEEVDRIEASDLPSTEKEQLVRARRGQGRFRRAVAEVESGCRLTGVTDPRFLVASHIKPWRDATDRERLDGHNGLLLAPHVDRLFDAGYLSFSDDGDVLYRDESVREVMAVVGPRPRELGRALLASTTGLLSTTAGGVLARSGGAAVGEVTGGSDATWAETATTCRAPPPAVFLLHHRRPRRQASAASICRTSYCI